MIYAYRLHRKIVVARENRRKRVYKRAGDPSVPFCEKGGARQRVDDFFVKKSEQS